MGEQKKEIEEVAKWDGRECNVLSFDTGKAYFIKKFKARESRLVNSLVYRSVTGTAEELAEGKVQISLGTVLANFEALANAFCIHIEDKDGKEITQQIKFFDNLEVSEFDKVQQILLESVVKVLSPSVLEVEGGSSKKA